MSRIILEPILRLLDKILCLPKSQSEDLKLPLSTDGSFELYKDIYKEAHGEMRARRDTEFKVVALYLQICAIMFAASTFAIINAKTIGARTIVCGGTVIIISVLWLMVHERITYDHRSYMYYRGIRDAIELRWFGKPMSQCVVIQAPPGAGYRRTQAVVAFCSLAIILIQVILFVQSIISIS